MNLESVVASRHEKWNDTERAIMSYVLANQDRVVESSVQAVAHSTFTSPSSVMRLTKKLGFSGFSELKYFLRHSRSAPTSEVADLVAAQRRDVEGTLAQLERADLGPVLHRMQRARTVYCYGTDFSSRTAAQELSKALLINGTSTVMVPGVKELKASLPAMDPEDLLVLISGGDGMPAQAELAELFLLRSLQTLAITRLGDRERSYNPEWMLHYCASPLGRVGGSESYYSWIGLNVVLDYLVRRYVMHLRERRGLARR
ncbi:MurR/RpiR family transcriptional regulator [Rothia sp. AR01]|uniref:MurR/RpiR family transcriptional regulator n=1 Tax=Rothia santali TaxID=2949643 RepID=A0A9X2HBX0_9MICC|nr:MurR/RpiR family transcriptional regulator [Rothia santali]MCP3424872.1 MurR/RpiR family transcriptional regulator [Rothia santali]